MKEDDLAHFKSFPVQAENESSSSEEDSPAVKNSNKNFRFLMQEIGEESSDTGRGWVNLESCMHEKNKKIWGNLSRNLVKIKS